MSIQPEDEHRRGGFREAVNELFGRGERGDTSQLDALEREDAQRRGENVGNAGDPAAQSGGARHAYGDQGTVTQPGHLGQAGADDPALQTAHGDRYDAGDLGGTDTMDTHTATGAHPGETTTARETAVGGHGDTLADDVTARQGTSAGGYDDAAVADRPVDPDQSVQHTPPQGEHLGEARTPHGGEVRGDTVAPEHVRQGGDPTAQGQVQHGGELRGDPVDSRSDADLAAAAPVRDADVDAGTAHGSGASTGAATGTGAPATSAGAAHHDVGSHENGDSGDRAALVTRDRSESYAARWDSVKGEFVDEPRRAVANADALVGELLDELQELFKQQRTQIEEGLDRDETSTEDLRVALRRYRSFFDRLLSI